MLVYHIVKNMQWQMLSSRGDDFGDGAMILGDFGDGAMILGTERKIII